MVETLLAAVRRFANVHADPLGIATTPIPGLTAIRADHPGELQYAISRPLVALVVQGGKRVMMGKQIFDFGAGDSMVIAADVPTVSQITHADVSKPYYALVFDLLPAVIEGLTGEMGIVQAGHSAPIRNCSDGGRGDRHRIEADATAGSSDCSSRLADAVDP